MASPKRIGFFWGEERITLVEFEKNAPLQVVSSPLSSQSNTASPFSSNFTEEIQITTNLQKMLKDKRIAGGSFYVSLPMKEIILRSFIIPFVKQEDIQNVIKFEAKKYLPLDIQALSYVFYTIPFTENKVKRLQIIFFAVRKESLDRYERIFKQVNAVISYCEPCVVSLTKVLLFKKEINPSDHLAFLSLDKNLGRICFIDQGIPQFIREFPIGSHSPTEETKDSPETLNLKIVNEVGNSLDFYARQFSGYRIDQVLISAEAVDQNLFNALESELKLKVRKVSSIVNMGGGQSNDMDAVHAMGACVEPPIESLSGFNFLEDKSSKSQLKDSFISALSTYKESIYVFLFCAVCLVFLNIFLQTQLKDTQQQYDKLSSAQGALTNESLDSIQAETQQYVQQLDQFKKIRTTSDVAFIFIRVAKHLHQGVALNQLSIDYDQADPNSRHVAISMSGAVYTEDPNEEMGVASQISLDFKADPDLLQFFNKVDLLPLTREVVNGKRATGFGIHCSYVSNTL